MTTKYFTILGEKDTPPVVPVKVDSVGLREEITKDPEFQKRAIVTTMNMFFKDFDTVVYIAPNTKLKDDPLKLYTEQADATLFRFEKILEGNPKSVHAVWDVAPQSYIQSNCIMMKNKQMAREWLEMTGKPFFKNYNGWELDVLNMLVYYGDYKSFVRDISEL